MAKRRKSERELRVEMMTWALLVLVFAIIYLLPDTTLPNWLVHISGAGILLGSGIYQYTQRWRVSPVTWLVGGAMLSMAFYNLQIDPARDFYGEALLLFCAVIAFGVITGET